MRSASARGELRTVGAAEGLTSPWGCYPLGLGGTCLVVPNDTAYLELIGEHVAFVARQIGFDEHDVARIRLAVDEACTNVLHHAHPPQEPTHFAVTCEPQEKALVVRVWDRGPLFDPQQVPLPDVGAYLEKRRIGGLGLYLMRKVMDEVFVEPWEGGKAVVLVKYRARREEE